MRIGILTHPLHGNYGGMLQAFALCQVLRTLQHEPVLFQYRKHQKSPNVYIRSTLRRLALWLCRQGNIYTERLNSIGKQNYFMALDFETKYIGSVEYMPPCNNSEDAPLYSKSSEFDCFIVGSDQVWRCLYVRDLRTVPFFFLRFFPESLRRKSIAYAASFGSDQWEGTPEETSICKKLLQQFKSVSVREHSGISLCQEVFDTPAEQMPDPTLLLHPSDYEQQIIKREKTIGHKRPFIASYILDENEETQRALQFIAKQLNLPYQNLMPHTEAHKRKDSFVNNVAQWLRYFRDADFIVTDSFHGCVFSIIFNKPFICFGNHSRGSARFDSLLGTFDLKERLISPSNETELSHLLQSPIDWARINSIHDAERTRGLRFLQDNLN